MSTPDTAATQVQVTAAQASEISGLLDVCSDEYEIGNRDNEGWGRLDGGTLTILDAAEAIDDLRWRAHFNEVEGSDKGGASTARSLRSLADKIEATR